MHQTWRCTQLETDQYVDRARRVDENSQTKVVTTPPHESRTASDRAVSEAYLAPIPARMRENPITTAPQYKVTYESNYELRPDC